MFRNATVPFVLSVAIGLAALNGCGTGLDSQLLSESPEASGDTPPAVEDELLLLAAAGASADDIRDLVAANDATVRTSIPSENLYVVGVDPDRREETRAALADSPLVDDVTDNSIYQATALPNDPRLRRQWHLTQIDAPDAWDITTGSEDVVVAVLDTGVDPDHPELIPNLLDGWNTYNNTSDAADVHGHGTKVAGIIAAATDNGTGLAGLGWDVRLLPVRIADDAGLATSFTIASAMRWARSQGAHVINISFAPLYWDRIVAHQAALARLDGAVVVIAAGNTGYTSKAAGSPDILFVGATDADDAIADFSNRGPFIDLVAPGVRVYTTMRFGKYGPWSGTSFSAPIVSGVAGLVYSVNPALRPVTVESILTDAVVDLGAKGLDSVYGHGRIDARQAVEAARSFRESADDQAPTVRITSPDDGDHLSQATWLRVDADDNREIADVLLSIDGELLASDPVSPYRFVAIPSRYAAGSHTVSVVAVDSAGNTSEPDEITLVFDGAADSTRPTVTITSPRNNTTIDTAVSSIITLIAEASDDRQLMQYEILLDGKPIATDSLTEPTATIVYNWDALPTPIAAGTHTLAVRVTDSSDNQATASIQVSVLK